MSETFEVTWSTVAVATFRDTFTVDDLVEGVQDGDPERFRARLLAGEDPSGLIDEYWINLGDFEGARTERQYEVEDRAVNKVEMLEGE